MGGRAPKEHKMVSKDAIDLFTDRTEPQKAFWDIYEDLDPGNTDVIHYYGEGGIGKSTLLKKIMDDLIKQGNNNVIMYSFEATQDKADFLSAMAREIGARIPDADFSIFYHAFTACLKAQKLSEEEIELKLAKSKSGVYVAESLKVAVTVGTDFLPLGGNTVSKAGELLIDLIADIINKKRHKGNQEDQEYIDVIDKSDQEELLKSMQDYFAYDCKKALRSIEKPFVFLLDGYEFLNDPMKYGDLASQNEVWISGRVNEAGLIDIPNTLWVIAGRTRLKWSEELLPADHCHLLGTLSKTDVSEYFGKAKDPKGNPMSDELITALFKLTNGMPVFMDMCMEEFMKGIAHSPEEFGQDTRDIAVRYIQHMNPEQQTAMKFLCGLTNVWTDEMVKSVYKKIESDEPYDIAVRTWIKRIKEHTFVDKIGDQYKLHDTLRRSVRDIMDPAELKKIADTTFYYLSGIVNNSRIARSERIEIIQLLDSNVDEYIDVLKKTDSPDSFESMGAITDAIGQMAEYYEDAEIWGTAIEFREKICRYWEKCSAFLDGCMEKLSQAETDVAWDYGCRCVKNQQGGLEQSDADAGSRSEYFRKAAEHLLQVYDADDWKVLEAKGRLVNALLWSDSVEEAEREALSCFDAVRNKPKSERERVFVYVYYLWNNSGENNWDMFAYLEDMISEGVDRSDPEITKIIGSIETYKNETECWEDPGYLEYVEKQAEQYEEFEAQEKVLENEDLTKYAAFIQDYDETKEYSAAEIEDLDLLANHLDHFYHYDEAYVVLEKLYEIRKRQAGGQDTPETVKVLLQMADNQNHPFFGDYNEAEAILKKAYGIVCSDEKLEKECPLGEILKKLGEVEEMLEKPAEAVQYYEKLKEYQNAGGSVEMDATDLDDKLARLSGLS